VQIVPGGNSRLDFSASLAGIFVHLYKSDEKIENPVSQLLHIGMLIGRALVSVNGDALIYSFPGEIVFFA
jgi:hypothetical protein